jgi:hypothetical protein
VHFNSEQHITPWRTSFSWYPRGSCISNAQRPCNFCFELIRGWRLNARARREEWDRGFSKGPCSHCNGLETKEKRFRAWLAKTETELKP